MQIHQHPLPTLAECRERLQTAGLKVTHQRLLLFRALCGTTGHPDADTLYNTLRDEQPSLSLGTVYRVLDTFVTAGLSSRFVGDDGKMRFDANLTPHHHLICEDSNEISDFVDEELNTLLSDYFRRKPVEGFEVQNFHLHIHGKKTTT